MRNALAIAKKELGIYFTTPWAYVVFMAMVLVTGAFFMSSLKQFVQVQEFARTYSWARLPAYLGEYKNLTDGVVVPLWSVMLIITVILCPPLAMGLFAREKRQRTFELLMTAPVRPWEIVAGKYLGGLGMVLATLGITIVFPLILAAFGASESGQALEWQTVIAGYAGLLLLGALSAAVTMLVSSFTESEMLALVISVIVMLCWLLLRNLVQPSDEPWRGIVTQLSLDAHLQGMLRGLVEVKALVFFASAIAFCLLATHRKVESERWA
jgi:ABC-2 type transport system permease protein